MATTVPEVDLVICSNEGHRGWLLILWRQAQLRWSGGLSIMYQGELCKCHGDVSPIEGSRSESKAPDKGSSTTCQAPP
eukprot:790014-Amphidinium_carterae.1